MKNPVNPVVAGVIVVVVLAGLGFFFWKQSEGKSFTKSEAAGKIGASFDPSKLPGAQGGGQPAGSQPSNP